MPNKCCFPPLPLCFPSSGLETNTLLSGLQVTWTLYLANSFNFFPYKVFHKSCKTTAKFTYQKWHFFLMSLVPSLLRPRMNYSTAEEGGRNRVPFCHQTQEKGQRKRRTRNCCGQRLAAFCVLPRGFWWTMWVLCCLVCFENCADHLEIQGGLENRHKLVSESATEVRKTSMHTEVRSSGLTSGFALIHVSDFRPMT